nr:hypothetical protein [Streptomyces sp. S063]
MINTPARCARATAAAARSARIDAASLAMGSAAGAPVAVKKPGGTWKTGGGWKRANRVGSHVETSWGRDGHTGPKYPRNTRTCVEFRGLTTKACVTLK